MSHLRKMKGEGARSLSVLPVLPALSVLCLSLAAAPLGAAASSGEADEGTSEGLSREAGAWVEQAREQVADSRLPQALVSLDSALALVPDHFGARLLRAKIHSWQGRHAEAEIGLNVLLAERPADAETRLALAYLRYYQGRLPEASAGFEALLRENPADEDARQGLASVLRAQAPPPPPRLWRVDAGGEVSTFTRREQTAWNQQFIQLGRRLRGHGGRDAVVHARVERYRQFETTDVAVEAGVSRSVLPRLNTSFAAGWTLAPDFRPDWRLAGDAEIAALPGKASEVPSVWVLAGARYDVYESTELVGLNPGLRLGWYPWAFTARLNRVREVGGDALYGWTTRLDGSLPPIGTGGGLRGLRFWAGYADAPETLVRAGAAGPAVETILTRTIFLGISAELPGSFVLGAGYTRDDREGSWVRHAMSTSVAHKF